MKIQESGRSMIEMLGVLAIVGVLSVGGMRIYAQAMQKYRIQKVSSEVIDTIQHIRKFYAGSYMREGVGKYNNLHTFSLKDGIDVTAFEKSGDHLIHAMSDTVEVTECSRYSAGDGEAFCIFLYNMDREACAELLAQNWSGKLVAVGVLGGREETGILDSAGNKGRVDKSDGALVAYDGSLPIPLGDVAERCSTNGNTVFFKMR